MASAVQEKMNVLLDVLRPDDPRDWTKTGKLSGDDGRS
jgi:hypothetical protein